MEFLTFSDYLSEFDIYSGDNIHIIRGYWDVYEDDYIKYCKDNNYEWERL